tara:strand:- start:627 stop:830 length:204 start_codon:yes stop_codon:yes gene_type:complete
MFGWCKKFFKRFKKPKVETIHLKELQTRTKKQLESIGRRMGIELDRRLTKSKLINKIKFRAKLRKRK